jgi:hypothetical protein
MRIEVFVMTTNDPERPIIVGSSPPPSTCIYAGQMGFLEKGNQQGNQASDHSVHRHVRNILHLTLHRKWFGMILLGQKKEEYREMKPYWNHRLSLRKYDAISFRNGYAKDAPQILVELKEHLTGLGIIEWGAPPDQPVHILRLGQIIFPNVRDHRWLPE